jgi:hypothetical protein
MEKELIDKLISVFLFSFKYFIPVWCVIASFENIFTIKNTLKKAGVNYFKVPDSDIVPLITLSGIPVISFFLIIFYYIRHLFLLIICLSYIFLIISEIISYYLFGNITGIYENGMIRRKKLIEWKKIHSYIINVNENKISGYFNNGVIFELNNLNNIKEIKELFEKNKIMDREKL